MSNPLNYMGGVTASTRQIAAEVNAHLNKIGKPLPVYPDMGSSVIWGKDSNPRNTEHYTGRALDFMIRNSPEIGDAVVDYVWANRTRFGLIHVIWRQRIKSTRTQPGVWRKMADRGSPTENHMDHPHCYFSGKAVSGSAKVTGGGTSGKTYSAADVKRLQGQVGVTADGYWGQNTEDHAQAIRAFLRGGIVAKPAEREIYMKVRATRPAGKRTTDAFRKGIQWALDVKRDGIWGPATEAAFQAMRDQHKMKNVRDKTAKPSTPKKATPPKTKTPVFPLKRGYYFGPKSGPKQSVSGYYSHRADLRKWQAQMRKRGWSITADGLYGPATRKVARQFQKEKRLGVDGLIGVATWNAAWEAKVT